MAVRPIDANALHAEISKWPESVMYKDWVQSAIANAPTLTPPNEALICDGCLWAEMGALEKCSSCMRDKKDNYYRRPPEGEENHDGLRKAD